jgi:hypothetical protein
MHFSRSIIAFSLATGLFILPLVAQAADFTGFLYVTDYKAATLNRYRYDYHQATNTIDNILPYGVNGNTSSSVFVSSTIKEGLQGTKNDIIVVNSGGSTLTRYDLNGAIIGTINVKNANGTAYTLRGIGNVVITQDGNYLYAPEEAGNRIDKIDLATGKIVAFTSFTGAHDLALAADGTIYASAYNNADTTNTSANTQGVFALPSDLSSRKQIIGPAPTTGNPLSPNNLNGLTGPSGISVASDGSLYIQQNVHNNGAGTGGGPDGVYHYSTSGSGTGTTAAFVKSTFDPSLHFTFGNNIGPDGNLYIAALGGASGRGGNDGYTEGVYKFDTSNFGVSLAIAGRTEANPQTGTPTQSANGLVSPKYLQFGFNFVPVDDPGAPSTPEPSGALAGLGFLGMVGGGMLRTRLRRNRK